MKIRKETKTTSTRTAQCVFLSVVVGVLAIIGFGPVAGIAAGIGGFIAGYIGLKQEEKEQADALIGDAVDEEILRCVRSEGRTSLTVKTEIRNHNPGLPPLGRFVFGDRLTKQTTYYLDDDE